jgi:hypothetical protein
MGQCPCCYFQEYGAIHSHMWKYSRTCRDRCHSAIIDFIVGSRQNIFLESQIRVFGFMRKYHVHETDMMDNHSMYILRGLRAFLLRPATKLYIACDHLLAKSPSPLPNCPVHAGRHQPFYRAPTFFSSTKHTERGGKCAADTLLFIGLYSVAGMLFLSSILIKQHE